jgi:tetratricopeptide (TPR) repeat protein
MTKNKPFLIKLILMLLIEIILLLILKDAAERNILSVTILKADFNQDLTTLNSAQKHLSEYASTNCYSNWLLARISIGDKRENALQAYLRCTPTAINLFEVSNPDDILLASQAVNNYPNNPYAWFWLGDVQSYQHIGAALDSYIKVIQLDQKNGLAWCRVGDIYNRNGKKDEARDSYFQCCINGDPGGNGCLDAGKIAEGNGNILQAVQYYRLSADPNVRGRGLALEKQLNP